MMKEGITRSKQQLVGGYSNVAKYTTYPYVVSTQMRELLMDTKVKKSEKRKEEKKGSIRFSLMNILLVLFPYRTQTVIL